MLRVPTWEIVPIRTFWNSLNSAGLQMKAKQLHFVKLSLGTVTGGWRTTERTSLRRGSFVAIPVHPRQLPRKSWSWRTPSWDLLLRGWVSGGIFSAYLSCKREQKELRTSQEPLMHPHLSSSKVGLVSPAHSLSAAQLNSAPLPEQGSGHNPPRRSV